MTTHTRPEPEALLARPFPGPGPRLRLAYHDLHVAAHGTQEQRQGLGNPFVLPRPWDPPTCTDAELRYQLWVWLEEVVTWLNREYTWDVAGTIPACWPHHPHLVHEIAVIADQRRRAGLALTSDVLEEWHRSCLPSFLDRMSARLGDHCEEGHQGWPARGRHRRHLSDQESRERAERYRRDAQTLDHGELGWAPPRLGLVDLTTGELQDDHHDRPS